jgi:hypothetical protein
MNEFKNIVQSNKTVVLLTESEYAELFVEFSYKFRDSNEMIKVNKVNLVKK